ncbi:MAG TPA: hypothetical protein VJ453_00520 [Terriglobales bacterium]|nr:hypothetical protein [Terriglobales bacterium]
MAVDIRRLFAYRNSVDERQQTGALLIAATLTAAIRLRGEEIKRSPKVLFVIAESVQLARMVLAKLQREP